jgi:serine/threonine protein kinase/tetratricopeptide (TPR) repeat protein
MPNDLIANRYQIVREIARSNDVVYEAVDTTLGRRMAVKELSLPQNLVGQAKRERIERFNREARAAGKLSHPNIVTVYAFGEHEGRHFIAMEYLEGQTLRDVMQSRGAVPLQEALEITSQVLSALSHAHSRQVVHRDIKPDNIQILPGGQIKLTDFGIARLTEEASLTSEGQVFGTPSYMSPEQIEGRFIDHRSDLFSLSVVLYEMLAGRKPFTGDSVVSITYAIMHNDPAPLVGVPFGVEQAIFRTLSKDPGRRFSSADEMRNALKNADAVPSMFLPRQPTGIGGYGAPAPFGQFPQQYPAQYPQPPGVPGSFTGGYYQPQQPHAPMHSQPNTVFAPPPQVAPPAASGQPFVNWTAQGQPAPPGYVPPPPAFPRQPSGPLISDGAIAFFKMMLLTLAMSGAVIGFVLLFLHAYDQQKVKAGAEAVRTQIAAGTKLYDAGKLEEAAEKFYQAYKISPDSKDGKDAAASFAVALNKLGTRKFNEGRLKDAEGYWLRAQEADPENKDITYNLGKLYDRMGDKDRAMREWQKSADETRVGGDNPAGAGTQTAMQSRIERARLMYNKGMELYNAGDIQGARDQWQQAVGEAPGSPAAINAQKNLDQSNSGPNF